jgi:TRAP-type C4-dicarboxylate transport system permease small subunit
MQRFSDFVARTDKPLKALLILLMALLVVNVSWQVITRFVLPEPSSFTEELSRFMLIWIGLLGSALTYKERMHLGIDILTNKLNGKKRLSTDLSVHIIVGLFAILVMIMGGYNLVLITFELNQVSAALGVRMGYVYMALPVSGALILLYSLHFISLDLSAYNASEK